MIKLRLIPSILLFFGTPLFGKTKPAKKPTLSSQFAQKYESLFGEQPPKIWNLGRCDCSNASGTGSRCSNSFCGMCSSKCGAGVGPRT